MKQQDTSSGTNEGVIRTVIDGQQRFTTIILFFYVLCQKKNKPQDFKDRFFNYNNKLVLQHNYNDSEIFNAIILGELTSEIEKNIKIIKFLKLINILKKILKKMILIS